MDWQERTRLLLGDEKMQLLKDAHVFVAGMGGVGGSCAEALARAGIGKLSILDADIITPGNINRQLIADHNTLGMQKIDAWEKRLLSINPEIQLDTYTEFIREDNIERLLPAGLTMVADAIDTLKPKVALISYCLDNNIPIVSSLGAGGKLEPAQIQVADISKSYGCRFGRMLRKRLHKLNIYKGVSVVFSPEYVSSDKIQYVENEENKKTTAGTISYMPALFGNIMAAEIIRKLVS